MNIDKKEIYSMENMVDIYLFGKKYSVPDDLTIMRAMKIFGVPKDEVTIEMGFPPDVIRRVAIAMYEGEINMVIHAGGGIATVTVFPDKIEMVLDDSGPGIADIELAMREGFSTAPENIRNLGFGAGMGLPNMKRNTDSMKIESELGKGTKITMTVNT